MNNSALTRLKKHLAEKDLSACLITSSANIGYLTGFYGFSPFEREAYLLVTKTEQFLLTDARYTGATEQLKDFVTLELTREMRIVDHLNQLLANHNLIKIGFEDTDITVAEFVLLKKLPVRFSQYA